jgi:ADP-ribose pyrophosphatase YjhB (NUDIX family)
MNIILESLTIGTILFDEKKSKLLLVHKKSKHDIYTLGLPGGRLQKGEDFLSTARKTIKVEIGLDINDLHYIGVYTNPVSLMVCFAGVISIDSKISDGIWIAFDDRQRLNLDSNIYEASNMALMELKNVEFRKSLRNINATIDKTSHFLIDNIFHKNGFWGWHHHVKQEKIGIIGTAIGAMTLIHGGVPANDNIIVRCLETLKSKVNTDGGWSIKSIEHVGSPSITESTCYCVDLLLLLRLPPDNPYIENAVNWLINNYLKSGGWGTNFFSKEARILPTTLSITTLCNFNDYKLKLLIEKAIKWLLVSQNKDGGWGSYSNNEASTPAHTARVILAVENYTTKYNLPLPPNIQRGIKWLLKSKKSLRTWVDASEIDYVDSEGKENIRMEFKHSSQPLCLSALMKCGHKYYEYEILEGVFNIISNQKTEGYWYHSLVPGHIPIWATYDNVKFLLAVKTNILENNSDLLNLIDYQLQTQNTVNALLEYLTPDKSYSKKILNQSKDEIKNEIKKLILLNNTKQALEIILSIEADKNFINEVIVLSSRLNQFEMQERLSTIAIETINIERNKLNKSILDLIDTI